MKDSEIIDFVFQESVRLGIDEPTIEIRKKDRNFGMAYPLQWKIILNKSFVHRANKTVVKHLISHEMLHLLDYWIRGPKDSGKHDKFYRGLCDKYGVLIKTAVTTKSDRRKVAATSRAKE